MLESDRNEACCAGAGDLSALSTSEISGFKDAVKAQIASRSSQFTVADITSVMLAAGSIVATATFAASVPASAVAAVAADLTATKMVVTVNAKSFTASKSTAPSERSNVNTRAASAAAGTANEDDVSPGTLIAVIALAFIVATGAVVFAIHRTRSSENALYVDLVSMDKETLYETIQNKKARR